MARVPETPFGLSRDEVFRNNYTDLMKRRKQKHGHSRKFSDRLSREGQIAMQLAREDSFVVNSVNQLPSVSDTVSGDLESLSTSKGSSDRKTGSYGSTGSQHHPPRPHSRMTEKSYSSFSEIYARTTSARMKMDITDENFSWDKEARKPLRGGKLESTLEIVEVVNADEPKRNWDEDSVNELARLAAMNKCKVWMEACAQHQFQEDDHLEEEQTEELWDDMDT